MPHVTFIYPAVGHVAGQKYIRSWQMEPLGIGVLSGLTPTHWDQAFFDDRLEKIDYRRRTDLVAISIETFTARRGYQIASRYRSLGIPVVMGGYHATFCPDEVLQYADAVCAGDAEKVWASMLSDAAQGRLGGVYEDPVGSSFDTRINRSIFSGKRYFNLALIETSRGCPYHCSFCSISAFHRKRCKHRPVAQVIQEIKSSSRKAVFFIDDNLVNDPPRARELFHALKPMKIQWVGQASIDVTRDTGMLDLMKESGCAGLLIGFESLNPKTLQCIQKGVNRGIDYSRSLARLRKRGIVVYGTFLLGLPGDDANTVRETVDFARREKLFIAAFNHVIPFPGTPLYRQMEAGLQLIHPKWWLSGQYRFGEVPFRPGYGSAAELSRLCHEARKKFYSFPSILGRAADHRANCKPFRNTGLFFGVNLMLRKDICRRRGLPLGDPENEKDTNACRAYSSNLPARQTTPIS